jgi:hypothetical protein
MKKFSRFLESTFKSSNLRRVRLKVDPAFCIAGEISKYQGYEGFILAENEKTALMYIENFDGGVMVDIPCDMIDVESGLSKLERLKMNVLIYLKENKDMKFDSPLVQLVMKSPDVTMLETFLLDNGCTEKDLLEIYRSEYL